MTPLRPAAAAMCIAAMVLALGWAAGAGPAPSPSPTAGLRVTVTADIIDVDARARIVTATGRVRVTDGANTATAARGVLRHNDGRGVLTGSARVSGPQGVLEGDEITFAYTAKAITRITARGNASLDATQGLLQAPVIIVNPATETVVAEDKVTFFREPDTVASGRRLTYHASRGAAILEGGARLQNREGFIQGDRIEGFKQFTRATATGGVVAKYRDIDVRSRTAEYHGAEKKIVFVGDVEVVQPGRRLLTERATIWYAAGRVVAEGETSVRIEPTP